MSEPIYPDGYDPEDTYCVIVAPGESPDWSTKPFADNWPYMLGLLTIIGDAVRGVPWGSAVASPELPEVGSVWISPDMTVVMVLSVERDIFRGSFGPDPIVCLSDAIDVWSSDFFGEYRPATVIPTPTADNWRRLTDVQPDDGQMCWWWDPEIGAHGEMWACELSGVYCGYWLWQPVPAGVIPPPPAPENTYKTGGVIRGPGSLYLH